MMELIIIFFTMQLLLCSAIEDIQTYHIPNYLTFFSMGLGVLMLFLYPKPLLEQILILFGLVFLLIIAYYHMMGMGDVKLYMAILLLNGFSETFITLLISCIILIIYACITHLNEVKMAISGVVYKYEAPVKRKYPFAVFTFFGYSFFVILKCLGFIKC